MLRQKCLFLSLITALLLLPVAAATAGDDPAPAELTAGDAPTQEAAPSTEELTGDGDGLADGGRRSTAAYRG